MHLYEKCDYVEERPVLVNYSNDVLRHTLAFYQNQWIWQICDDDFFEKKKKK